MRSFFRNLERESVEFILISGQAAVLYGASTFSEDFDLWVRPSSPNLARLKRALGRCGGKVYKLTPPITLAHARRGHGFHFTVPDRDADAYIDVMARPPRVGSFANARRRCELMESDWGTLPVVGIPDLIKLKLTRRLADYDVISSLVRVHARRHHRERSMLAWSVETTFSVEDLAMWSATKAFSAALSASRRPSVRALIGRRGDGRVERARLAMAREIAGHQAADVAYWRPIIDELRELRRTGNMLEVGSPVE